MRAFSRPVWNANAWRLPSQRMARNISKLADAVENQTTTQELQDFF
jgi:hypothetical protein